VEVNFSFIHIKFSASYTKLLLNLFYSTELYVTSCRLAYHLQCCPLSGQSTHVLSDRAYKICGRHQPPYTTGTSPERRVFLHYVHAKCSYCIKCRRKFRRRFPNAPRMSITKTNNNFVKSFRATCSIPDSKRTRRQHVLKKNQTKLAIDWRHFHGKRWLSSHNRRVCLDHQHAKQ